jgi:hypothetical protein
VSDKPISAEVVRADQIRVRDRIVNQGKEYAIELVEEFEDEYGVAWISTKFTTLSDFNHFEFHAGSLVARILPEPVEVRESWRATCNQVTTYGSEIQARAWASAQKYQRVTIEHVRETIISREEVQP